MVPIMGFSSNERDKGGTGVAERKFLKYRGIFFNWRGHKQKAVFFGRDPLHLLGSVKNCGKEGPFYCCFDDEPKRVPLSPIVPTGGPGAQLFPSKHYPGRLGK